ncbi:MAG: B12-binding domain-containing radical SAM protein [Candidatus Eremiobacteraeota bacterium]|nr:B12-binding domain-containing radical SAM protein [Candidatus Eremiobacteraeota bacterium]
MKLLLAALSGVRVYNQALLELGLTLPGFVERSQVIASLPSLGLLTLAALTPPNWEVVYRDFDAVGESELLWIEQQGFDLVAISALTARILEAYRIADLIRGYGGTVVLGGLHVTALPWEAQAHADALVVGEGEPVWAELLQDYQAGRLQPVYNSQSRSRRDYHLSESPLPAYELLRLENYNRLTLQTTRGCPLDCEFCAASRMLSFYKKKPLERIRAEVERILELWPRPFLELADDNTFVSKPWGRSLAELLAEYPLKWFSECDISVADDEELLEILARSNCAQLLIGLEAAEPEALQHLDSRNWKYDQFEAYQRKIDKIQSYGISVNGCFILGLDSHTPSSFEVMREYLASSSLAEVQITLLTPFPGTALERRLRREDRLLKSVYWEQCTLFDVTFRPKNMGPEELEAGFMDLMTSTYTESARARRAGIFRQCRRDRRSA